MDIRKLLILGKEGEHKSPKKLEKEIAVVLSSAMNASTLLKHKNFNDKKIITAENTVLLAIIGFNVKDHYH